jgi:superfamily II DNA or RNA helicase
METKNRTEVQNEAITSLGRYDRSGVAVSMGVGKTLIGLKHLDSLAPAKALVVAPKKSIFQSWKDEMTKHGIEYLESYITFSTYISLPKQDLNYDVVYLDECHNLLPSHEPWLTQFKGKIVGLTGTPPKFGGSVKGKLVSKFCPIKYEYFVDDAVSDGILNDYKIVVHMIPLGRSKNMMAGGKTRKWPTSEMESYIYWSDRINDAGTQHETMMLRIQRMKAMMTFPSKETYAKKLFEDISDKCILFANTQSQADKLCRHSYHSENEDSEENLLKFKAGIITKLSAVLQLNEGVNIPELRQGIIMHAYGNERKSSQRIGRLLRLNPDETATVHILCFKDTIDEAWTKSALSVFDQSKIIYKDINLSD